MPDTVPAPAAPSVRWTPTRPTIRRQRWALVILTALIGAIAGCESRLSRENYDRIQPGMDIVRVLEILGDGEKQQVGGASTIAQGMMGEIHSAQRRAQSERERQGVRELEGTTPPAAASSGPGATKADRRTPLRERWIWRADRIEISVDVEDGRVVSKNQTGL